MFSSPFSLHWYLAVIYNPAAVLIPPVEGEEADEDSDSDAEVILRPSNKSKTGGRSTATVIDDHILPSPRKPYQEGSTTTAETKADSSFPAAQSVHVLDEHDISGSTFMDSPVLQPLSQEHVVSGLVLPDMEDSQATKVAQDTSPCIIEAALARNNGLHQEITSMLTAEDSTKFETIPITDPQEERKVKRPSHDIVEISDDNEPLIRTTTKKPILIPVISKTPTRIRSPSPSTVIPESPDELTSKTEFPKASASAPLEEHLKSAAKKIMRIDTPPPTTPAPAPTQELSRVDLTDDTVRVTRSGSVRRPTSAFLQRQSKKPRGDPKKQ